MREETSPDLAIPLFPRLAQRAGLEAPDPFALSLQSGLMVCGAVAAAVQLRLPHLLDETPRTVTQLAHEAGAHAQTLLLLLRALTTIGIFLEIDRASQTFAATARSRALRTTAMGDLVALWGDGYQWEAWEHLTHTVRTGRPALEVSYGEGATIWTYLRDHGQEREHFQLGLTAVSSLIIPALLSTYDFAQIASVADVGGGYGALSEALLRRYPALHVTLFDQPNVIAQVRPQIKRLPDELASRYHLEAGSFFEQVPAGAALYVLKNVLMDWSDQEYVHLLHRCRQAMSGSQGRVLVIEPVLDEAPESTPFTAFFSLHMCLMMQAAHHRTLAEHVALAQEAGFSLALALPLGLEQMLLEFQPAEPRKGPAR